MDREPAIVPPDQPLERVLRQLQAQPMQPVLVVGDAGLEGVITVDNLAELLEIARTLGSTATVRIRS